MPFRLGYAGQARHDRSPPGAFVCPSAYDVSVLGAGAIVSGAEVIGAPLYGIGNSPSPFSSLGKGDDS